MRLDKTLSEMAQRIAQNEIERKKIAIQLRKMKTVPFKEIDGKKEVIHETLISKMERSPLKGRIGGVDGGLLSNRYHSVDLMVVRAVASVFNYDKELKSVDYYPEKSPSVTIYANMEGSDVEFLLEKNIRRQIIEVKTAILAVKKSKPEMMLLHGPVAPYLSDKPKSSSKLETLYRELVSLFLELYKLCQKNKTYLAGVVEDSRGGRLSSILKEALPESSDQLKKMRDTALLYDVLDYGERTFPFRYSIEPHTHPVVSDLLDWGSKLYSFYAKTAQLDRPIRVDFIASGENVTEETKRLSSKIFTLSSLSRLYGMPTVITEADHCAKLRAEDINLIYDLLREKVGDIPSMLKLRREARPFG